jgi:lysophospholipase L1-like esterase
MPVCEYSVDAGPFQRVQLTRSGGIYSLPLAVDLNMEAQHRLEFYFCAADLQQKRWKSSTAHLRIAGLAMDRDASLEADRARPKRAIAFGDSITEGVGAEGLFTTWNSIGVNNARLTWFPLVATALGCEYGQLGSGGWGVSRTTLELPPLPQVWDRYDAATSRLTEGCLLPEPDYIFCLLGTNDPGLDIAADYIRWLAAMRRACPNAIFFCIVPPLGVHKIEIRKAVATRNSAGDRRVHLIDTAPLKDQFRVGKGPTNAAYDGVHPSVYGQAMLGALIAVEVQKVLN